MPQRAALGQEIEESRIPTSDRGWSPLPRRSTRHIRSQRGHLEVLFDVYGEVMANRWAGVGHELVCGVKRPRVASWVTDCGRRCHEPTLFTTARSRGTS